MANRRFTVDEVLENLWSDSDDESDIIGEIYENVVLEEILRTVTVVNERELEQSARDRELPSDVQCGWGNVDEPQILMGFTGESGLQCDIPDEVTPLNMFNILFDDDMWVTLTNETNRYANNRIARERAANTLKPFSRLTKWTDVSVDEMKLFMALVTLMGIIRKPGLEDYWSTNEAVCTPFFSKKMPKDRFMLILSNIHLNDNSDDDNSDALFKVRPFLRMINVNFLKYNPEKDLSFDEGTCPFKGRVRFRVYNPMKPNKFGIKLFNLCEASSGYSVGLDIYHGDTDCAAFVETLNVPSGDNEEGEMSDLYSNVTQTTKIVLGMLARTGCLSKGHHIYMDNYYTSPELFDILSSYDTYACGTVRINRKEVPKVFGAVKLRQQDETIFRRRDNLLALKYHDKRDVHMLSAIHGATSAETNRLDRRTNQPIRKLLAIIDYIKKMGGVDLSDQIIQYYDVLRRCVKWWKKLFFHLFNLLVVNAYALYRKYGDARKRRTHMDFRQALVEQLIDSAPNAPKPQRKGRKSDNLARLTERHFLQHIKPKPGAKKQRVVRDCIVCNPSKKSRDGFKRKQTAFECEQCVKPMCNPECFKRYHTMKKYKLRNNDNGQDQQSSDSDSE